jgi:triacylglycerol lipase
MKKAIAMGLALCLTGALSTANATVRKTAHPVVFAHGLAGWDNILGAFYFGDNVGNFVGDACNEFLEVVCNGGLNSGQKAYASQETPFQSSEVRGTQLADKTQSYMATVGASYVNLIGHSQGGIDARKAAVLLKQRKGYTVVKTLISVSSPHRGSPTAKYILDLGPGVTSVIAALATIYGNIVYNSGNDVYAAAKQLVYKDYSSTDGVTTGMKAFNTAYAGYSSAVSNRIASVITAQQGLDVNPALFLLVNGFYNIDGNGAACAVISDDCDNDGALGKGNGNKNDSDDDGLVGINSQQMGYRLTYSECFLCDDYMTTNTSLGYLTDLNNPTSTQQSSSASVVGQDHLDVTGVGPDTMDENEFYAAIIDYMAANGG